MLHFTLIEGSPEWMSIRHDVISAGHIVLCDYSYVTAFVVQNDHRLFLDQFIFQQIRHALDLEDLLINHAETDVLYLAELGNEVLMCLESRITKKVESFYCDRLIYDCFRFRCHNATKMEQMNHDWLKEGF